MSGKTTTDDKHPADAADRAPRPEAQPAEAASTKQDAPNYRDKTDGGRALPSDEVNSANDE